MKRLTAACEASEANLRISREAVLSFISASVHEGLSWRLLHWPREHRPDRPPAGRDPAAKEGVVRDRGRRGRRRRDLRAGRRLRVRRRRFVEHGHSADGDRGARDRPVVGDGVGERERRAIRGGELLDERDRHLGARQGRRSRDGGAEARDPGLRFGRGRPRDGQGEPRTGGGDACRGAGRCDRRAAGIERFEPPLGAGSGDDCGAAVGSRQEGARDGAAAACRQQEARLSAHVELVRRLGFVVAVELRVEQRFRLRRPRRRRAREPRALHHRRAPRGARTRLRDRRRDRAQRAFTVELLGELEHAFGIVDGTELPARAHESSAQRVDASSSASSGAASSGARLVGSSTPRRGLVGAAVERLLGLVRGGLVRRYRGSIGVRVGPGSGGTSAAGSGGVGSTPSSTTGSSDAAAGGGGGGTTPTQTTTTNGRALIYAALVAPTVTTGQASGDHGRLGDARGQRQSRRARDDLLLPVRDVAEQPELLDAFAGRRLRLGPGAGHGDRLRPELEPELLVPAGGDELVRDDRRRPGPLHDHGRSARNAGPEHDRDDGTGLVGHLDRRHVERHGDPGRARHDLLLPVRAVADRSRLVDADRRSRLRLDRGAGHSGRHRVDARTELLVPGRRDELVGNRERRARRLHVRGDADLGHHRPGDLDRCEHRDPQRKREPGWGRHERPLRVRDVLHEPDLVDAGGRRGLRVERDSRHRGVEGAEAGPELLVPGRRDELVGHDERCARPVHDRCGDAGHDGAGLAGGLDVGDAERDGEPGRA